jgi:hypothetical protein|tara:strand:- start:1547 stop:1852 length:306 start_codon:yes stop_codon:yes gene_type:complete
MLEMIGKFISTAPFSALLNRLIACLIFLLLTVPLIEQAHEDSCEYTVCSVCIASLITVLPSSPHFTEIVLEPAKVVGNEITTDARQPFTRSYNNRGPPQIS